MLRELKFLFADVGVKFLIILASERELTTEQSV